MSPGALLRLETDRFTVRSMEREDVSDDFIAWLADKDVMVGMNTPRRRLSRAQAVRFVLSHDNHRKYCLGVWDRREDLLVGFFIVSCDRVQQVAETSVVVGLKSYWGKDVVKEVRSALLDYLFFELDMVKVIGRPHGRNFSSIFNYKALGFTCEAVLRRQLKAVDGDHRLDQLVFGIFKDEWQERRV